MENPLSYITSGFGRVEVQLFFHDDINANGNLVGGFPCTLLGYVDPIGTYLVMDER